MQKFIVFIMAVFLLIVYGQVSKKTGLKKKQTAKVALTTKSLKITEPTKSVEPEIAKILKSDRLTLKQKQELYELSRPISKKYVFTEAHAFTADRTKDELQDTMADADIENLTKQGLLELNQGQNISLSQEDLDFIDQTSRELNLDQELFTNLER